MSETQSKGWDGERCACGRLANRGSLSTWLIDRKVWEAAGYGPDDYVCSDCLMKRLRERLGVKGDRLIDVFAEARAKLA